ncbi:protein-disulfide reductase DsbD [Aliidiomarina sp. Khilg15.8]
MKLLTTFLFLLTLSMSSLATAQNFNANQMGNSDFLPVDQAFQFDFQQNGSELTLRWQIADGYYLYQHRFSYAPERLIQSMGPQPKAEEHYDEFFGETFIYRDAVEITLQLVAVQDDEYLDVTFQGCADAGLCYAPTTHSVPLQAVSSSSGAERGELMDYSTPTDRTENTGLLGALDERHLVWTLVIFFALGIGLAFTPCVFPMYPIVATIIGGQKGKLTVGRGLLLSFIYVQGMAVTYTALGILVALAGMQYQSLMQHPAVLITLAAVFVVLALGMFGAYTLQLPASWQTRLNTLSQKQRGGAFGGVFVMGALSGLIASPCTTAPLSGALLFIAQSGDVVTGGAILYALSIGMGVPLLIIGASGGKLLPKAGPWMHSVKLLFGLLLVAVALFLTERLLPMQLAASLWLLFIAISVITLGRSLWPHFAARGRMLLALILALIMALGIVWQKPFLTANTGDHLEFETVSSLAELQSLVAESADNDQWVMLDLYADWCVACKEFEIYTFTDPAVQAELADMRVVQADVTRTNATNSELLGNYQVLGLPTILFFRPDGSEATSQRVTGFMNADDFTEHLQNLKNE